MDRIFDTGIIGGADGPTSIYIGGILEKGGMAVLITAIVVGLLLCFFGLKVTKVIAALIGFAAGAAVGVAVNGQFDIAGMASVAVIFACAVVLAVLAFLIYRLGVFLMAFSAIAGVVLAMVDTDVNIQLVIALVVALVLAVLAVVFVEPVVIVITACSGGVMAGMNIAQLAGLTDNIMVGVGISAVLAAAGLIVQFMMHSRKVGKKEKKHSDEIREHDSMETEVERARTLLDEDDDEDDEKDGGSGRTSDMPFDDIEILDDDFDEEE